jgi:hypothetical protein
MTYAKLLSETAIDRNVPHKAYINNRLVVGELPADYLATQGFYPLEESETPTPREGNHYEARYAFEDMHIQQTWVEVENPPPPPRTFSKRKLYRALSAAEVWTAAKAYMEGDGVWEDWEYATTLDEDDPLLIAAVSALKTQLGLTDEQVEAILEASKIE